MRRRCAFVVAGCLAIGPALSAEADILRRQAAPAANPTPPTDTRETVVVMDTGLAESAGAALALFETEASGINVLGLNRVQTQLNGRQTFTVRGGNTLGWQDVSREWMAGVDVTKVADASMIEGGIGGTVNIRTRKPLEADDGLLAFSAGQVYSDLAEVWDPYLSVLYNRKADTAVGGLGLMLTGLTQTSTQRKDVIYLEPFIPRSDLADGSSHGGWVYMPRGFGWREQHHHQDQQTWSAALQLRTSPAFETTLQYIASAYDKETTQFAAGVRDTENGLVPEAGTRFQFDDSGVFRGGQLASTSYRGSQPGDDARFNGSTQSGHRRNTTSEMSLDFSYAPDTRWAVRGSVQNLNAETDAVDFTVYTSRYLQDLEFDLNGPLPAMTVTPAATLSAPEDYFWNAAMDHWEDSHANLRAARLDAAFEMAGHLGITSLQTGVRHARETSHIVDSGYNWRSISDVWNEPLLRLTDYAPQYSEYVSSAGFFHSGSGMDARFWLPSPSLTSNIHLAEQVIPAIHAQNSAERWRRDLIHAQDHSRLRRETQAAYVLLKFEHYLFSLPARGYVGVRHVDTSTDSHGFGEINELHDEDETLDDREERFADGSSFVINQPGKYRTWLPSAQVNLTVSPALLWRLSLSQNMTHPDLNDLRSFAVVRGETVALEDGTRVVHRWLGEAGSPRLQPIKSSQFDTALEWQFSETGRAHAAAFNKRLADSFERRVVEEPFSNNGETRNIMVERLVNGGDARIRGVELGMRQKMGFLSDTLRNMAFEFKYAHIESTTEMSSGGSRLPLEGLSPNNWSLSGTYQNDFVRATFNYRWRDDYLQSAIDLDTQRPTWQAGTGRLDASLGLILSANLELALEAHNLANTMEHSLSGPYEYQDVQHDRLHPASWTVQDRQVRLMLRGRF